MPSPQRRSGSTRRDLLRTGAATGVATIAGCSSFLGTEGSQTTTSSNPTPQSSPTTSGPSPKASPTATGVKTVRFNGGGPEAFAKALRTVEANPGSTLDIAPGTYHLNGLDAGRDYRKAHFVARGLDHVTIDGHGALLVFEDARLGGLHVFGGQGTVLKNLRFEYANPPYTRATITAVDEEASTVEIEIDEGYPGFDEGVFRSLHPDWATVHDAPTGDFQDSPCCGGSVIRFDAADALGTGRYRLRNLRPWRALEIGRKFVAVARVPEGSTLQFVGCSEPVVEGITVHTSPLFVALVALCSGPTFRDVTARPRPGSDRPITTTADGFHVVNCHPGPTFDGCHLERLQDDAFAIDTKMPRVAELVDDRTVRLEVVAAISIQPGDTIEAISPGYGRQGTLPEVTHVLMGERSGWPTSLGSPIEAAFARPIDGVLEPGSFLLNRSRANAGFAIRNCVVKEVRARHVRITSRDGIVEANEFTGSTSPSILLQPTTGYTFNPKGPAERVTIRNNVITRAGLNGFTTPWPAAIVGWVNLQRGADGGDPPGQPNRAITVTGNDIRDVAHRGVHIADTAGVVVRNNRIQHPNQRGLEGNGFGFGLDNVSDVELRDNRVSGSSESLRQFAVRSDAKDLVADGNELVVDGRAESARVVTREHSRW